MIEADWVGKTPEEYLGYDEDDEDDYDEDHAYESRRDMEMEYDL